jgi:hypothetical protein
MMWPFLTADSWLAPVQPRPQRFAPVSAATVSLTLALLAVHRRDGTGRPGRTEAHQGIQSSTGDKLTETGVRGSGQPLTAAG